MGKERLHLVVITGFGDKGVPELITEVKKDIGVESSTILPSADIWHAFQHPDKIIERLCQEIERMNTGNEEIILIGHSYGAFIALGVALRLELKKFLRVILIDGPVNPHKEVKPQKIGHHLFARQYTNRVRLATQWEEKLKSMKPEERMKIITIAGQRDRIVPHEAKIIPGFEDIQLRENKRGKTTNLEIAGSGRPDKKEGKNFRLPPQYVGHSLKSKIEIIRRILQNFIKFQ